MARLMLRELCTSGPTKEDPSWGQGTAIIEACTDLDYGVGMDSGKTFADFVAERAYAGEGHRLTPPDRSVDLGSWQVDNVGGR